jgi:hypothetical protein
MSKCTVTHHKQVEDELQYTTEPLQCEFKRERVDVETAQYLPDDPEEEAWTPTVEVALYAGSRYRLIGLTPQEARQLAAVLAYAPYMPGMASGPDSQEG